MLSFKQQRYRLFLSLLFGSSVFFAHTYRFFSAEGFLPIIFLSALSLNRLNGWAKDKTNVLKFFPILITLFVLLISPTILMYKAEGSNKINFKFYGFDSTLLGMIFPDRNKRIASQTLWYPNEYLKTVALITRNTQEDDIIYSKFDLVSVCIASLSGRATSTGLFTEMHPAVKFDPMQVSKLFIATREDSQESINNAIKKYNLAKIGENKFFVIYKNNLCYTKANFTKSNLPFWVIFLIGIVLLSLFLIKKIFDFE
jgi:hypothetical protein